MSYPKYASVLLDLAIDKTFDYGIPEEHLNQVERGVRVEVPVRGFLRSGYVYAVKDQPEVKRVQPIKRLISDTSLITDEIFELGLWMAKYYCAPIRQVFKVMLPASVRGETKHKEQLFVMRAKTKDAIREYCEEIRGKKEKQVAVLDVMLNVGKGILLSELLEQTGDSRSPVDTLTKNGWLKVDIVRVDRSPLVNEEYFRTEPKKLSPEQQAAFDKIVGTKGFQTHLLHGVTGSGKTEVYLQAIDATLKQGKGVIMLVPEISLTPQTIQRFRSRFEGQIAILHHRLSHGERFDEWHKIRKGEAPIVIGARSAIFSPVPNLGMIIVDEEHEQSYKQSEEAPCYHARDVAVMRGKMADASVILGSATPSLESTFNAKNGKYLLSVLNARADKATIPKVTIVDMKREFERNKGYTNFSDPLLRGIKERAARGEQTILFLNRRGYHTTLLCNSCREPVKCEHCDLALTFHRNEDMLSCHLCGFTLSPPPRECPGCHSTDTMKFRGVGTEQVERSLHAVFDEIRTIRIDADTTRHKGSHQRLLRDFGTGKADVLIGTQMIAKGLHFPEVTLVGILNCDASLNIPDFRSAENTFQLMTQVAGRSGRGVLAGEVIIQTCMPDNEVIQLASKQDYNGFYEAEIHSRELFRYPPFAQMAKLTFSGTDADLVKESAGRCRASLIPYLSKEYELHPVIPCGYPKIKDKYRFQFLIRGPNALTISKALTHAETHPKVRLHIDINPLSTYF